MNKGFKYRIYPNEEQRTQFAKTFGCVRFVWNRMLEDKNAYYEVHKNDEHKKTLNVTPAKYKAEFEWLKEVDSLALCNTQLNLEKAYSRFYSDSNVGFPKFKSKKSSRKSYTTNFVNENIVVTDDGYIKLPKTSPVMMKMHRPIPNDYKIKSATVSLTPTGKYFVSVLCEYVKSVVDKNPDDIKDDKVIGMDFSVPDLYADSNGHRPGMPKYYKQSKERLAFEQRRLSHMKKGSSNYIKQKARIAKIHEYIANQRKDALHKESTRIANAYDCVCIETLDMDEMKTSTEYDIARTVSDDGWGNFTAYLAYKLKDRGKPLIEVSKWFPSSQLCHNCGYRYHAAKDPRIKNWECPECHEYHNRDVNAALNIRDEGIRILKEKITPDR